MSLLSKAGPRRPIQFLGRALSLFLELFLLSPSLYLHYNYLRHISRHAAAPPRCQPSAGHAIRCSFLDARQTGWLSRFRASFVYNACVSSGHWHTMPSLTGLPLYLPADDNITQAAYFHVADATGAPRYCKAFTTSATVKASRRRRLQGY